MNWQQEQQVFWDLITRPHDLRDSTPVINTLMAPHRALTAVEALGIYNNAYHQRLIQISAELYPVTYHTLGKDIYTRLWLDYIAAHPPRPGPMGMLGEHLLEFTRNHAQFGKLPALLDIIALESLLISLFDKADEPHYTKQMLQALPAEQWPHTRWQPKQDWALLHSRFDLEKYWADMQSHLADSDAVAGASEVTAAPVKTVEGAWLLVRRVNHRMQFQQVNAAMALFLNGIQAGHTFARLCETLAASFPDQDIPALSLQLLLKTVELQLLRATD
ncbi:MAG: DNA-binding domain-containing protein [Gammaproteobacteria bacterium]|nr:DNA-binding domain-containing protein [Gammaproteobacteria bacterium]